MWWLDPVKDQTLLWLMWDWTVLLWGSNLFGLVALDTKITKKKQTLELSLLFGFVYLFIANDHNRAKYAILGANMCIKLSWEELDIVLFVLLWLPRHLCASSYRRWTQKEFTCVSLETYPFGIFFFAWSHGAKAQDRDSPQSKAKKLYDLGLCSNLANLSHRLHETYHGSQIKDQHEVERPKMVDSQ